MLPAERLRIELAAARAIGFSFDDCWPQAVILASRSSSNPTEWMQVLAACRGAWERAFERMPGTVAERALDSLDPGRPPDRDYALEGRMCRHCGRGLPSDLDPRALFCEDRPCRRQFNYELERRRAGHAPRAITHHGWDAARAARLCEHCTTNYVPLDRERFCCEWCEREWETAERRRAKVG